MPTIRLQEWTKKKLEQVRDDESHSSFDSVVKALLRDRKIAQMGVTLGDGPTATPGSASEEPTGKSFEHLTALAELSKAKEGILFLWCPNCGNEIAHIAVESPMSPSVFEVQCQQCLSQLNHHGLVVVEIGHPVEEHIIDGAHKENLRSCIIDYWDRKLARLSDGTVNGSADRSHLVWQIAQYDERFDWDWPVDVPVVRLDPGKTYRNESTDEYLQIREQVSDNRNVLNSLRVNQWGQDVDQSEATVKILNEKEVLHLITSRLVYRVDDP